MKIHFESVKVRKLIEEARNASSRRMGYEMMLDPKNWLPDMTEDRKNDLLHQIEKQGFAGIRNDEVDKTKAPACLILAGSGGLYLLSNAVPEQNGMEMVIAYPKEADPAIVGEEAAEQIKIAAFGPDDGTEYLPVDLIEGYIGEEELIIDLSPSSIIFVPPEPSTPRP